MAEQARILVVDDEPAVQNALFRALTLEHYDVARASDGQRGARAAGGGAVRGDHPRHRDAAHRRPGGVQASARRRRQHARADAHRPRRGRRSRRRPGRGRGRLPGQAVRPARAARARARAASPGGRRRRQGGDARLRGPAPRPAAPTRPGAASGCWRSRAPSSCCWRCSCAIRARCSPARRSSRTCGATTSGRAPTRWASTWATCGARPRPADEPRLLHTVRGVGYVLRSPP